MNYNLVIDHKVFKNRLSRYKCIEEINKKMRYKQNNKQKKTHPLKCPGVISTQIVSQKVNFIGF